MLVLSRREGEAIYIGKDIVVTVIMMDSGKVKLGIEAPRDVKVSREEVRHFYNPESIKDGPDAASGE